MVSAAEPGVERRCLEARDDLAAHDVGDGDAVVHPGARASDRDAHPRRRSDGNGDAILPAQDAVLVDIGVPKAALDRGRHDATFGREHARHLHARGRRGGDLRARRAGRARRARMLDAAGAHRPPGGEDTCRERPARAGVEDAREDVEHVVGEDRERARGARVGDVRPEHAVPRLCAAEHRRNGGVLPAVGVDEEQAGERHDRERVPIARRVEGRRAREVLAEETRIEEALVRHRAEVTSELHRVGVDHPGLRTGEDDVAVVQVADDDVAGMQLPHETVQAPQERAHLVVAHDALTEAPRRHPEGIGRPFDEVHRVTDHAVRLRIGRQVDGADDSARQASRKVAELVGLLFGRRVEDLHRAFAEAVHAPFAALAEEGAVLEVDPLVFDHDAHGTKSFRRKRPIVVSSCRRPWRSPMTTRRFWRSDAFFRYAASSSN